MAKGISINFLADVKDFLKGTKNVEDELDDVADSLDDVAKEGEQATEKLEDGFKELAKAAKKTGDDVGANMKDGYRKAGEGAQNFKEEATSTAKETAASFDGSAESITDAFQEVAANAFVGFGTQGVIAGLAAAGGMGLASAAIIAAQEEAQKATDRVNEFGQAIIDTGYESASLDNFQTALREIVGNTEDAAVKMSDLEKFTKKYGDRVPKVEDMAMAYAGNADAIESVVGQLEDAIDKEESLTFKTKEGNAQSDKRITAYQEQIDKIEQVQRETELAKEIEQDYLASGGAETRAKADTIQLINDAYDEAVYAVDNFKDAETGIYDLDAYAQSIRDREKLLQDYQTSLAESGLTTDQKKALNEMGVEQANAILNGLKDPGVSEETKKTIKNGLKTASAEGSGVAKKEIEDAFKKPVQAKVEVKADTEEATKTLDALIKNRTAKVTVKYVDRYGKELP